MTRRKTSLFCTHITFYFIFTNLCVCVFQFIKDAHVVVCVSYTNSLVKVCELLGSDLVWFLLCDGKIFPDCLCREFTLKASVRFCEIPAFENGSAYTGSDCECYAHHASFSILRNSSNNVCIWGYVAIKYVYYCSV